MLNKLKEISTVLEDCRSSRIILNYCLIGGLAVAARGYPRATADIDFAVQISDSNKQKFCSKLDFSYRDGDVFDPLKRVYFPATSEESIQLIEFWPQLEEEVFKNVSVIQFDSQNLRVIGLTELLLIKFLAGSKKDLHDIEELVFINPLNEFESERLETLKKRFLTVNS